MGLLDFIPVIGPALNAASGLFSESNARSAFKSRYQDTVADMRAAGLNPALAYGQGGGNPSTVPLPQLGSDVTDAIQGVASAKQAKQAAANQAAQADLTSAQAALLKAQTADLVQQIKLKNANLSAGTQRELAQAGLLGVESQSTGLDVKKKSATLTSDIAGTKAANTLKQLQVPRSRIESQAATGAHDLINSARTWWDTHITQPDERIQDELWAKHIKAVHAKAVKTYMENHPQ